MRIKKRYFIPCFVLLTIVASTVAAAQDTSAGGAKERELIAVLQSDAAKGEKAITCKQLAIHGTDQSVPMLAPLLSDAELASWARIALEAIPGPVADAALRDAMDGLQGRLLVGVINSIAVRRDVLAVDALMKRMGDTQVDVACAAAVALGQIGGTQAAMALTQALETAPPNVRSAVAEGCILCAERFLVNDRTAEAVDLYDTVRQADVPDQRHLEAIRGAILARGSAGLPMLIEQLQSPDLKRFGVGLRTARELGGRRVTEELAAELTQLSADRQPLLLLALADRNDSAVLPTVLRAAGSPAKDLRLTAIVLLIRLGDVSCVPVLLEAMTEEDASLEQAAMETLIRLPGQEVDAEVVAQLTRAQGRLRRLLITVVGQRQIQAALPLIVSNLSDADAGICNAAIQTIGIIGQAPQAGDLVRMLQDSGSSGERETMRKALLAVCGRSGTSGLTYLMPLTQSTDNDLHQIGLHALAIIGGPDALGAVTSAIENADTPVADEAVRILSTWPNNWPDDDQAGQALLLLARSAEKTSHQVLGLRGFLRYISGNKQLNNDQKVAQIMDVLAYAKRPEEKRQAIAALAQAPSVSALDLLIMLAEDPPIAEEAYSAMVVIASQDVRGVSKARRQQVLKVVIEQARNNGTKQRAQKALRKFR